MNVMATPTKRRVLGSLDVNVLQMSPRSPKVAGSPLKKASSREASAAATTTAALSRHASPSPRKASGSRVVTPKKRVLEEEGAVQQPVVKKLCSSSAELTSATDRGGGGPAAAKHATVVHAIEDGAPASQPTAGRRSISPDASSLFDTSVMNTSQDTTITEPDTDAPITITTAAPVSVPSFASDRLASLPSPPPPPPRRVPTREEFRQKAEILRLRLSLATYKVKTGQADVPLEELQVRPVPGMTTRRRTPLPSMSAHTIQQSTPAQEWYRSSRGTPLPGTDNHEHAVAAEVEEGEQEGDEEEREESSTRDDVTSNVRNPSPPAETGAAMERNVLPRLPPPSAVSTPRKRRNEDEEEARLTSSALRGGAAKGLLSLSQGSL